MIGNTCCPLILLLNDVKCAGDDLGCPNLINEKKKMNSTLQVLNLHLHHRILKLGKGKF